MLEPWVPGAPDVASIVAAALCELIARWLTGESDMASRCPTEGDGKGDGEVCCWMRDSLRPEQMTPRHTLAQLASLISAATTNTASKLFKLVRACGQRQLLPPGI